jgi:hypothetical protein
MFHPILDYEVGMKPEQIGQMVAAMTPEKRKQLAQELIHGINRTVDRITQDPQHLWLTGELPMEKA